MALVLDPTDSVTVLGVVTLEDVLEQLFEYEIYDELDVERGDDDLLAGALAAQRESSGTSLPRIREPLIDFTADGSV